MIKTVQFLFAFLFLWFLISMMTGQIWLFPLVFVGLCVYAYYDQRKLIAQARIATKRANEARATADRLAEEARIAADRYAIAEARANKLTEAGVALFTCPN